MAVLASDSYGYVVCHETYINNVCSKTKCNRKYFVCTINPVLFNIFERFRKNKSIKTENKEFDSEVKLIQTAYESIFKLYAAKNLNFGYESNTNKEARNAANKFYTSEFQYPDKPFSGGNNDEVSIIAEINNENYILPKKCTFYSCDIKDITKYFQEKTFQFILMDPPWWNKFIRRKRKANAVSGYTMLYDNDLIKIPVNNLLHEDGLVGIWCTSAPSHINAILTELFPAWNVEFVAQWYWLKVTKCGQPICAFSPTLGKQPYERIIFGKKKNSARKYRDPDNKKVIMSVPSAIHSHKPPICDLMKPYIPENGDCLEIFARYLLPNWTSYGNEVLKLQHSSLYNMVLDSAHQSQE